MDGIELYIDQYKNEQKVEGTVKAKTMIHFDSLSVPGADQESGALLVHPRRLVSML